MMNKAVEFHGHSCPGLAMGVMAAKYILDQRNSFSIDEELVVLVENDNCSVDAIQALLGATFGKGNLIFLDYGKNNYTFYNRKEAKAFKLTARAGLFKGKDLSREERVVKILNSEPSDLFRLESVEFTPPGKAKIYDSVSCSKCGEPTMITRTRERTGSKFCIPCFEKL